LRSRFELACRRLNLNTERSRSLTTELFRVSGSGGQMEFAL